MQIILKSVPLKDLIVSIAFHTYIEHFISDYKKKNECP